MKKKALFFIFFYLFIFLFLSYKILLVPPGINIDEASIGYNGSLIARNLRDQNNRLMPVFILTLDGKDWKQPLNVYTTALVFKILGRSYFNLRLVSVIFALFSSFVFYQILRLFFNEKLSFIGLLLFISSPSILLQSHLASDNIAVLPFFTLWLYFFFVYFVKSSKPVWLFAAGVCLGISLYSYKAMHAMVPVYFVLSSVYLLSQILKDKTKNIKPLLWYFLGVVFFLLPLPWLQQHYAGAIFDPAVVYKPSFFNAAYVYLTSFDFSFLFLTGDIILIHSTGRYGMFLLPCLLLLFLGLFQMIQEKNKNYYFILFVLLLTPLLLTTVNSVYRASRLMTFIPTATFIFLLGIKRMLEMKNILAKRIILFGMAVVLVFNYGSFVAYYWTEYPKMVRQDFTPNLDTAVNELFKLAKEKKKAAYLEKNIYFDHKDAFNFFWDIYSSGSKINLWQRDKENFPDNGLILTNIEGNQGLTNYQKITGVESDKITLYLIGK